MPLEFAKMQALGNDFVVLDRVTGTFALKPAHIRVLGDRRLGVGCDQVLVIGPPRDTHADFFYRAFNASGDEVEQCGNGLRCAAAIVRHWRLSAKSTLQFATDRGLFAVRQVGEGRIQADLGQPDFRPLAIPLYLDQPGPEYSVQLPGGELRFGALSLGNPHAVVLVASVATAPVAHLGAALQQHGCFPQGVNVGFCEIMDPGQIRLRVYERGVGETPACGSGACAAVAFARWCGLLKDTVEVHFPGGDLWIRWQGEGASIKMIGEAHFVFSGSIDLWKLAALSGEHGS